MIVVDGFNKLGIKNHPVMNVSQVRFPLKQLKNAHIEGIVQSNKNELAELK